jgi:hypothetical protein
MSKNTRKIGPEENEAMNKHRRSKLKFDDDAKDRGGGSKQIGIYGGIKKKSKTIKKLDKQRSAEGRKE